MGQVAQEVAQPRHADRSQAALPHLQRERLGTYYFRLTVAGQTLLQRLEDEVAPHREGHATARRRRSQAFTA